MKGETAEPLTTLAVSAQGEPAERAAERPSALPRLSVEFATEAMARHYRAAWMECLANVPLRQLKGVSPWRAVRRGETREVQRALGAVGLDAAEVSDVLGYCAQVRRAASSPDSDSLGSLGGPGGACGRGGLVTLPHAPVEDIRCKPSAHLLMPQPSLGGLAPIEAAVGGGRHELALLARLATDPPQGPGTRIEPGDLVRWLRQPTPACGGMSPLQVCAAARRARASRRLAPGGALAPWLPAAVRHDEEALALIDAVVAGRRGRGPAPADGRALVVSCARMWLMAADALGRGAAVAAACELAAAGVSGLKREPDEVARRHGAHSRQVSLAVRMLREILALEPFDVRFAVLP